VFCLENVRARTTNMDITSFFPKHLVLTYIHIPYGTTTPSGPDSYLYRGFTITLRYTTVGRNPLDEWWAWPRNLYRTTHNTQKRLTSIPNSGIRSRNSSEHAVTDPRLRPQSHSD